MYVRTYVSTHVCMWHGKNPLCTLLLSVESPMLNFDFKNDYDDILKVITDTVKGVHRINN